jgi:hypothetical protein
MSSETLTQRIYSDEEIRNAINSEQPFAALEIVLSLVQRMTLALESIAHSMQEPPTVLFEQAPTNDGLGVFESLKGEGDKEH